MKPNTRVLERLSRRRALARLGIGAGAGFLLPLTDRLIGDACGAPAPYKRVIFFVWGNGFATEHYRCTARTETDFDLSESWMPLAAHRQEMLILSKFRSPFGGDFHGSSLNILTVTEPAVRSEKKLAFELAGGPSIDRVIAKKVGGASAFSSVYLSPWHNEDWPWVSWDEAKVKYPPEWNPLRAYKTLFGGGATPDAPAVDTDKLVANEKAITDFLADDIKRLQVRLAAPERQKLDQYITSMRDMEDQLKKAATGRASCGNVAPPNVMDANDFKFTYLVNPPTWEALLDVGTNAFVCGLTNVLVFGFYPGSPFGRFGSRDNLMEHHQDSPGHSNRVANVIKWQQYYNGFVNKVWERLKATPSGGGTLASDTLIVSVNSGGGVHHFGRDSHHVMLLGSAGGYLRTGRYLTYPTTRTISDAWVSVANAMGVPITTHGDPKSCMGALPNLT